MMRRIISRRQYLGFGIMYGLPKKPKSGLPMRPSPSNVNSHSYLQSKNYVELLKLLTVSSFSVKDLFTFTSEIDKLRNCNYSMASFYINSLFKIFPVSTIIEFIFNFFSLISTALYKGFDRKKLKQ